jgi:hypothetical protein
MGFEPTIPASERVKTVHALERSATMTGYLKSNKQNKLCGFSPQSELYRPSDRRLSAKLVLILAHRVSRGQRNESPRPLISGF